MRIRFSINLNLRKLKQIQGNVGSLTSDIHSLLISPLLLQTLAPLVDALTFFLKEVISTFQIPLSIC